MRRQDSDVMNDGGMPSGSAIGSKPTKVKKKSKNESPFHRYMKKNYSEHFRRINAWRRAARWALFIYPVTTGCAFIVPFFGVHFLARYLYKTQPEWFSNILNAETEPFVLSTISAIGVAALVLGLLTGIILGISRFRSLNFEAEKTEIVVQQNYFLNRIARTHRILQRG